MLIYLVRERRLSFANSVRASETGEDLEGEMYQLKKEFTIENWVKKPFVVTVFFECGLFSQNLWCR